jgi:hypothetical protein
MFRRLAETPAFYQTNAIEELKKLEEWQDACLAQQGRKRMSFRREHRIPTCRVYLAASGANRQETTPNFLAHVTICESIGNPGGWSPFHNKFSLCYMRSTIDRMIENDKDRPVPDPDATLDEVANEKSSQNDKGMSAENAKRHSDVPLSATQELEHQNFEPITMSLPTPPAESCSHLLASSSLLDDSEHTESNFISGQEAKAPTTIFL